MASTGPRYYGFVTGGTLDAALVAAIIAAGWDQCDFNEAMSPAAIAFEDVAGSWLKELLGLPHIRLRRLHDRRPGCQYRWSRAGRWHVLHEAGWDVGRDGLHGRHASASWSAPNAMPPSTALCDCWGSARVRSSWCPPPDGAMDTSALPAALEDAVRSCARRRGTSIPAPATT